jgi:hypothetical protein
MNKANFFWSTTELKPHIIASYNSFIANGWDVTIWTLDEDLNFPSHLNVRNANEILDGSLFGSFSYENCNVDAVPFSDLFRLYVVKHTKGWWFDSDCFCLQPYSEFEKISIGKDYVAGWEQDGSINNAVLYFNNDELIDELIEYTASLISPIMPWAKLGPPCITQFLVNKDITDQALPMPLMYNVKWPEATLALQDEHFDDLKSLLSEALVYHYYNSVCHRQMSDGNYGGYLRYLTDLYKPS